MNNIVRVGFTGTQRGMGNSQLQAVTYVIRALMLGQHVEFHHGDCIGADEQFHQLVRAQGLAKIVVHPPTNNSKRAWCVADVVRDPLPYLERDHRMVVETSILVAAPYQDDEVLRSGTWATIRYARNLNRPVLLLER